MAETIDEATIIAWVDGELDEVEAGRVANTIAADPALTALAERHRAMKVRFAAAFNPIAKEPMATQPPATVTSLVAVRAERLAKAAKPAQRWWDVGSAIAASLLVGVLVGHGIGSSSGVADRPNALALSAPIAQALDGQLSGDSGAVRVALSFQDRNGQYCRSFAATNLSGIACRTAGAWQLRYASPTTNRSTDYRMAGTDAVQAEIVAAMIKGDPLDRAGEAAARKTAWR